MTTTTSYGTWNNHGDKSNVSVEATIADVVSGADSDWIELMEASGAFKTIAEAYRDAVNAALPDSVSLCGDDFSGPYYEADQDFDGYPLDEDGNLDIHAIVEGINVNGIIDRYDVDTLVKNAEKAQRDAEEAAEAAERASQVRAEAVAKVVEACGGNQTATALLLGLDRSRVSRLVAKADRTRPFTLIAGVVGDEMESILGVPVWTWAQQVEAEVESGGAVLGTDPNVKAFLAAHPTGEACPERVIYVTKYDLELPANYPLPFITVRVKY